MIDIFMQTIFDEDLSTYAILDSAVDNSIFYGIDAFYPVPEFVSLFEYPESEEHANLAPYLIKLQQDNADVLNWVLDNWNKNWGIFINSPLDIQTLAEELKDRFYAQDKESGQNVYVRFFDPRTIYKYLRMQTLEQAEKLTKIIPAIYYENPKDTTQILKAVKRDDKLYVDTINLKAPQ